MAFFSLSLSFPPVPKPNVDLFIYPWVTSNILFICSFQVCWDGNKAALCSDCGSISDSAKGPAASRWQWIVRWIRGASATAVCGTSRTTRWRHLHLGLPPPALVSCERQRAQRTDGRLRAFIFPRTYVLLLKPQGNASMREGREK